MKTESCSKQNQYVEDYLDLYRHMKNVDFAIMITGSWGCGKTHFIEEYLKRACTPNGEKEYIYVSLNGLSRTADIDMALFQAAHPVLGSKLAITAGKIFKASVKAGLKLDLDINGDGNSDGSAKFDIPLNSFKLNSKSKLLVFDDLERCLLKPEEVLGYINAFVENREAKVIIVGDETQVASDKNEDVDKQSDIDSGASSNKKVPSTKYRMIKEKVVGKTFRLKEAIEDIFENLITKETYPDTYDIILRNKADIVRIFQKVYDETEKHNYRALKHCLRDFEYFYPKLEKKFRKHEQFVNDLLYRFVAFGYELLLGHYLIDDLRNGRNIFVQKISDYRQNVEDREKTGLELVFERHDISFLRDLIFDWELWYKILGNRYIEVPELSECLKNSSYFPEDQPEWVTLLHWLRLNDNDALKALTDVKAQIAKRGYRKPEIIVHVFGMLLKLSDRGAIPNTKEDILRQLKEYLNDDPIDVSDRQDLFSWDLDAFEGLGYTGADFPEFTQLTELVDETFRDAVVSARSEHVPEWLKEMRTIPVAFSNRIKDNFSCEPVFELFSPKEFINAYDDIANDSRWIITKLIKNRYSNYSNKLSTEKGFVEGVINELSERISVHDGTMVPSVANAKDLLGKFEEAKRNIFS
ncbi:MAG: P-loop NTPase fold protein [Pseudomonadota bacterium]|nr:P-loop NTPase fold protein [Pseudomonadota bacterium]